MPETKHDLKLNSQWRRTVVVEGGYPRRWHQTQAAIGGEQGLLVVSMEELAARLAGGFLRSIRTDTLKERLRDAAAAGSLEELDTIKGLPGFQRAAAATLSKAWRAPRSCRSTSFTAGRPSRPGTGSSPRTDGTHS